MWRDAHVDIVVIIVFCFTYCFKLAFSKVNVIHLKSKFEQKHFESLSHPQWSKNDLRFQTLSGFVVVEVTVAMLTI